MYNIYFIAVTLKLSNHPHTYLKILKKDSEVSQKKFSLKAIRVSLFINQTVIYVHQGYSR